MNIMKHKHERSWKTAAYIRRHSSGEEMAGKEDKKIQTFPIEDC